MRKVLDALARHADTRADATAVIDNQRHYSYQDLSNRAWGVAQWARTQPDVIGILAPNGFDWMAAWFGLARAGKTIVALPTFFSEQQRHHVVTDSGIGHVLSTSSTMTVPGTPVSCFDEIEAASKPSGDDLGEQARHITYTSGTTGQPKGVRLGGRQIDASAQALLVASGAGATDRYLSVLPFSLLLEQICGICVPMLAGAPVTIAADVAAALVSGDISKLSEIAEDVSPTVTVLMPDFLNVWVGDLGMRGKKAPESLRFVAVGGAPVPGLVADEAWRLGIPVHEGYGLSECCSVVAVNRPGRRTAGSVGQVLDGLDVEIRDGEICVSGPTVMDGYLHGDAAPISWPTGDLGGFDDSGNLVVRGRKDRLVVLANGRNVSPEWIEAMILNDTRIARCRVGGEGLSKPHVRLVPLASEADWFAQAGDDVITGLLAELCRDAPEYARPGSFEVYPPAGLASTGQGRL